MTLSSIEKKTIIKEYETHSGDTGTAEVQIALLSKNIDHLTEHLQTNKQDEHTRYGLKNQVQKRRKLLKYLKKTDIARYRELIKKLGLRDVA